MGIDVVTKLPKVNELGYLNNSFSFRPNMGCSYNDKSLKKCKHLITGIFILDLNAWFWLKNLFGLVI